MKEITKQDYHYLCGNVELYNSGTNDYFGSAPMNEGEVGAFANKFAYRVHLHAEDKHPIKIIASWYIGCFNFENTDESSITTKEFEPSDEGAKAAFDWLEKEYNNCLAL